MRFKAEREGGETLTCEAMLEEPSRRLWVEFACTREVGIKTEV